MGQRVRAPGCRSLTSHWVSLNPRAFQKTSRSRSRNQIVHHESDFIKGQQLPRVSWTQISGIIRVPMGTERNVDIAEGTWTWTCTSDFTLSQSSSGSQRDKRGQESRFCTRLHAGSVRVSLGSGNIVETARGQEKGLCISALLWASPFLHFLAGVQSQKKARELGYGTGSHTSDFTLAQSDFPQVLAGVQATGLITIFF